MATKLNKDVTRESNVIVDERNLMVTLSGEQEIILKRKGMKSGAVKIKIEDLYEQLNGGEAKSEPKTGSVVIKQNKKDSKAPMINLHDFRSQYLIDGEFSYDIKVKLEKITTKLIK